MALCALILAHHKAALLARLIRRLEGAGITCLVHVDADADLAVFRDACHGSAATFIPERTKIFWGGYSLIEATIALARHGLRETACSHFLLISGDTYPIANDTDLRRFLLRDRDLIDTEEHPPGSYLHARIARTYLPDTIATAWRGKEYFQDRQLDQGFFALVAEAEAAYRLKQTTTFPLRYGKGSQWWCLRRATLERCLGLIDNGEYTPWFRFSAIPDESVFNTLVLNFIAAAEVEPGPVYTRWDRLPAPYEFSHLEEFDLLRDSNLPLARKFATDADLLLTVLDMTNGESAG